MVDPQTSNEKKTLTQTINDNITAILFVIFILIISFILLWYVMHQKTPAAAVKEAADVKNGTSKFMIDMFSDYTPITLTTTPQ